MSEKFTNMTIMMEFLLMEFPDDWVIQTLHAALFFLIYLAALMGNLLIFTFTTVDQHLQTPMYFFLKNLSLIDMCYISVTVPKSVMDSLTNSHSISFLGCASQLFLVIFFAGTENVLLIVMSYDRHAAICLPLQYEIIMNRGACVQMVTASWLSGCGYGSIHVAGTFSVNFCGSNVVHRFFLHEFFCDVPSLLTLACPGEQILEYVFIIARFSFAFLCFLFMIASYVHIFSSVLKIPSAQGKFRTVSTCMPHLTVMTLFLFSGIVTYLGINCKSASSLNLLMPVLYSMLPPSLNPVMHSLRNKDMKEDMEAAPKPRPKELLSLLPQILDPKALPSGLALGETWDPAVGLEAQLAALGLQQLVVPGVKTIGGGCCPFCAPLQLPLLKSQLPAAALQAGPSEPQGNQRRNRVKYMANVTVEMGFFLMEFAHTMELRVLHAFLFLLIYLATLMANLLIIVLATLDQYLHTPMNFFLKNLSYFDLCLISIIVPKSVLNSLTNKSTISLPGCLVVIHFAGADVFILTAMSYDRYVAICHPPHYEVIMSGGVCVWKAAASWFLGGVFGSLYSAGTFSLSFCGSRNLPQFFCDVPSLLKISCSKSHITVNVSVAIGLFYGFFCLHATVFSYTCIFNTVLSIPSVQGQSKASSTCLPHLIVVTIFLLTGAIAYLKPVPDSPSLLDLLLSVLYSVLPPILNPIIYSLRNKEIKAALRKPLWKLGGNMK
ncbi:LOW QUALITY PROTEIN: uncharacterized protein PS065_018056 [Dugong dugon]